jgi:site-specific recombinase XerD
MCAVINTIIPKIVPPKDELECYIDNWLTACRSNGLADRSIAEYEATLLRFHWWYTAHTKNAQRLGLHPTGITTNEIRGFVAYLREAQPQGRWGLPLSENAKGGVISSKAVLSFATVKQYATTVRIFFNFLEEESVIAKSPFTRVVKLGGSKKQTTRVVKVIPEQDIKKIFAYLTEGEKQGTYLGARNLAMVSLLLDTGIRRGELLSLNLGDVQLTPKRCVVNGKTGERTVFFSTTTQQILNDYTTKWRYKQGDNPKGEFWRTTDNRALSYAGLGMIIHDIQNKTGVHCHLHMLRHTFATMTAQRVNLFDLKALLGHTSVKTTELYYHTNPEALAQAYRGNSPMDNIGLASPKKRGRGRPRRSE